MAPPYVPQELILEETHSQLSSHPRPMPPSNGTGGGTVCLSTSLTRMGLVTLDFDSIPGHWQPLSIDIREASCTAFGPSAVLTQVLRPLFWALGRLGMGVEGEGLRAEGKG